MDRTFGRSRWRETEFMLHEVRLAIAPTHNLSTTLREWDQIIPRLAEPARIRRRYCYN